MNIYRFLSYSHMKNVIGILLWFFLFRYLPSNTIPGIGRLIKRIRYFNAKLIFEKVGKDVNVQRLCYLGSGREIVIGDYSGIGKNCIIPSNVKIGNYVMMAEGILILNENHVFNDPKKPMCFQGKSIKTQLTIEDDVWIGARTIILPQVTIIGTGSIIAAGSIVTKNVLPHTIIGGNPAKLIRYRS